MPRLSDAGWLFSAWPAGSFHGAQDAGAHSLDPLHSSKMLIEQNRNRRVTQECRLLGCHVVSGPQLLPQVYLNLSG
jgi:hypothetical protein